MSSDRDHENDSCVILRSWSFNFLQWKSRKFCFFLLFGVFKCCQHFNFFSFFGENFQSSWNLKVGGEEEIKVVFIVSLHVLNIILRLRTLPPMCPYLWLRFEWSSFLFEYSRELFLDLAMGNEEDLERRPLQDLTSPFLCTQQLQNWKTLEGSESGKWEPRRRFF